VGSIVAVLGCVGLIVASMGGVAFGVTQEDNITSNEKIRMSWV
jgi:hypothetical protein